MTFVDIIFKSVNGDLGSFKKQINKYKKVNNLGLCLLNQRGQTLLHKACISNNIEIIEYLLYDDYFLNNLSYVSDINGNTVLHLTYEILIFNILLSYNIIFSKCLLSTNEKLQTPLHVACENGYYNIIERLLQIDIIRSECLFLRDAKGMTPFNILFYEIMLNYPSVHWKDQYIDIYYDCIMKFVSTKKIFEIYNKENEDICPLYVSIKIGFFSIMTNNFLGSVLELKEKSKISREFSDINDFFNDNIFFMLENLIINGKVENLQYMMEYYGYDLFIKELISNNIGKGYDNIILIALSNNDEMFKYILTFEHIVNIINDESKEIILYQTLFMGNIANLEHLLRYNKFRNTIKDLCYLEYVCGKNNINDKIPYLICIGCNISNDIKNVIVDDYYDNPHIIYKWRKEYMMINVTKIFLLIVCICDEYFTIRNSPLFNIHVGENIISSYWGQSSLTFRPSTDEFEHRAILKFFSIITKLPIEIQMLISNMVYGINDNYIPGNIINSLCSEILS